MNQTRLETRLTTSRNSHRGVTRVVAKLGEHTDELQAGGLLSVTGHWTLRTREDAQTISTAQLRGAITSAMTGRGLDYDARDVARCIELLEEAARRGQSV
jgi:hypothetical protein